MSRIKEVIILLLNIITIIGCFPIGIMIFFAIVLYPNLSHEFVWQINIFIINYLPIINLILSIITMIIARIMKVAKEDMKRTIVITIVTVRFSGLSLHTILECI